MSDVRDYIHTVDVDPTRAQEIAQRAATKLETKELTLIALVESFGEYVKSEDATIRSKTIHFLDQILAFLPAVFLSRQELQVICQFLCDRITDGGAVLGLQTMQGLPRFNNEMAISTLRAMFMELQDLQLRPQSQRLQVLELLNSLMSDQRKALMTLGSEFITGVVDLVSGEKDPRNLMIIFSILRVIMIEWDISKHGEVLFDSVFCYFPVTFRPRPDDRHGISAQDLKGRLRNCISASTYFAPYAFPRLIVKLDSSSVNVKRDVLQTILDCVQSYNLEAISNYAITLWDSLKYEIFNAQEEDLAKQSIQVIETIANRLYNSNEGSLDESGFLSSVTKECLDRLQSPEHKQAEPAGKILSAIAKQSAGCLYSVIKTVLPSLLSLYQDANTIEIRRALLKSVLSLLESSIPESHIEMPENFSTSPSPLLPFKDELQAIFSQVLLTTTGEEVPLRILAIKCLVKLCMSPQVLQSSEIGSAVQCFNEVLVVSEIDFSTDLRDTAIAALFEISGPSPEMIVDITIPKLLVQLPDAGSIDPSTYSEPLKALVRLSVRPELSSVIMRRLFGRLDAALASEAPVEYCEALLSTLSFCFGQLEAPLEPHYSTWYERVIDLVEQVSSASLANQSHPLLHEKAIYALGRLTCQVVRKATPDKQKIIAMQIYSLFASQPVYIGHSASRQVAFTQKMSIILSTYILAGLDPHLELEADAASPERVEELRDLSLQESPGNIRQHVLQHLALLVNKFMKTHHLDAAVSMVCDPEQGLMSVDLSLAKIRVVFWISKALVLRLQSIDKILNVLLGLLTDSRVGFDVAHGFALLFAPNEFLTKENGANIRLLAKQKAFSISTHAIRERFATSRESVQSNYLIALCGILQNIDSNIILPEIKLLLPLLLQSLELVDSAVKAAAVRVLTLAVKESPTSVEEYVSTLITGLLRRVAYKNEIDSNVRFSSMHCLRILPGSIRPMTLIPYLKAVDQGVTATLDDPRRSIRKEAVDCRATWLAIAEPEVEDL